MRRIPLIALVLALAPQSPAIAQSLGCVERPVGPPIDATVFVPVPGLPRARAAITVPGLPLHGQECVAVTPPPRDILRGPPAPAGGLLRGDPPPALAGGLLRGDNSRSDLLRDPPPMRPPTGFQGTWPR